jgi:Tfp pilus assembly protein PilX
MTRATRSSSPAHRQRGGVTLVLMMVLIVLAALVGVLAVRGATADLKMAGAQRVARSGFYCAEAGLEKARALVAANPQDWATILAGGSTSWYPSGGVQVQVDGDNLADAVVTMTDNVDGDNDFLRDNDLTVILTSTCTSSTLEANGGQRTLSQIVTYGSNGGNCYKYQAGHGCTHDGNAN